METPRNSDNYDISIHAPREGCDAISGRTHRGSVISIHAPREGCDVGRDDTRKAIGISIHAPREGCDPTG